MEPILLQKKTLRTNSKDFTQRMNNATLLYRKYLNEKNEEFLKEALLEDNTNSDIVFKFLCNLYEKIEATTNKSRQKELDKEFQKEFEARKIFLSQKQIFILDNNDPFGLLSGKEILFKILDKLITAKTKEKFFECHSWLQEKYKLFIPYILFKDNNNMKIKQNYHFLYIGKKKKYCHNIQPNQPYSLLIEENCYRVIIFYILNKQEYIRKYDYTDFQKAFSLLKELIKSNEKPEELVLKFMIMISTHDDYLLSYIDYVSNQYQDKMIANDNNIFILRNIMYESLAERFKRDIFLFFKKIMKLKCLTSFLIHFYSEEEAVLLNDSFLDYVESITSFTGLFNPKKFGYTNTILYKIVINIYSREIHGCYKNDIKSLFHIGIWFITLLHEALGHFGRRYIFLQSNRETRDCTPREMQYNDDGGRYLETCLFGEGKKFSLQQVIFLLNEQNWDVKYQTFFQRFIECNNKIISTLNIKEGTFIKKLVDYLEIRYDVLRNSKIQNLKIQYCKDIDENEISLEEDFEYRDLGPSIGLPFDLN